MAKLRSRYTPCIMLHETVSVIIILAGMAAIAAGRIPRLRMNRAAMAIATAALLVAWGSIDLDEALDSIDPATIVLLFSMMIIVAAGRMSGAFDIVAVRLAGLAARPHLYLAAVVSTAGVLSALFLNDTMCLVLAPVVTVTSLRARRNPIPYLIAVATAANVGSAATIIGNPQNMLIGAGSRIAFSTFVASLGPVSALGLFVCWAVIVLAFPSEFGRREGPSHSKLSQKVHTTDGGEHEHTYIGASVTPVVPVVAAASMGSYTLDRRLLVKTGIASIAMLVMLLAGVPVALAATLPAAFLLASRRIESAQLLAGVDFNLLVFFGGLFVITTAAEGTASFAYLERTVLSGTVQSPWLFAAATTVASNIISNVPAVMVLSPLATSAADPEAIWIMLAMASTFAGNLTLIGSVANLIVAEGAASRGVTLGFWQYFRAGFPITVLTLVLGVVMAG